MGGVPGEHVLFAGLVEKEFGCSYGQNDSEVIGDRFEIRLIFAVFGPDDEILGDPEVDGRAIVTGIPCDVVAAIVSFADAGVSLVDIENASAFVKQIPVQAIQADTVIESAIIFVCHVSEEVGFVLRFFLQVALVLRDQAFGRGLPVVAQWLHRQRRSPDKKS